MAAPPATAVRPRRKAVPNARAVSTHSATVNTSCAAPMNQK